MVSRRGMLIVVSAPSGAGKTTLCREIRRRLGNLAYSVSYTTRVPRPGELDGQAYHFVSEGVFQQMVDRGELAEWARVHGHLYGTAAGTLETVLDRGQDILLDIDTQGARQLRGRYPLGLYVFVVAPSSVIAASLPAWQSVDSASRARCAEDAEFGDNHDGAGANAR